MIKKFEQHISKTLDFMLEKNKFKIGDIIQVTDGDIFTYNKLFKVIDINYSHETLELIKCKSVEFDSNQIYNFDNLCAEVVLRDGEFNLDFLMKNFYLIKK